MLVDIVSRNGPDISKLKVSELMELFGKSLLLPGQDAGCRVAPVLVESDEALGLQTRMLRYPSRRRLQSSLLPPSLLKISCTWPKCSTSSPKSSGSCKTRMSDCCDYDEGGSYL